MKGKLNYWRWFFKGSGNKAGYKRLFVNWWLCIHIIIGLIILLFVHVDIKTAANSVLLPLAGILVGLAFAWAGNAQALMQSSEFDRLSGYHEGGFIEYVFVYQTAILVILVTMVLWGLAGLGAFDLLLSYSIGVYLVKLVLFSFSSITVRECWHVVMGAQWMLLVQKEIQKKDADNK